MKAETFTPSFGNALRENLVVSIGMVAVVPVVMIARGASHPGLTLLYALMTGLIGAVVLFLYYTVRFLLRVPKQVILSETGLVLVWRNGTETRVPWDDVHQAVFRVRWGYRWKLYLANSAPILWGDGFSTATWEEMSDLVVTQLAARNIPMERYDLSGSRVR